MTFFSHRLQISSSTSTPPALLACGFLLVVALLSGGCVTSPLAPSGVRAGWDSFATGDLSSAAEQFSTAAASDPEDPQAHFGIGRAAFAKGDMEAAALSFARSTSLQPSFADAWAYLGSAQLHLEKPEEAVASLRRALDLEPENGQALVAMAEYAATVEVDYDKALAHLEQAKLAGYDGIPAELEPSLRQNLN